MPSKKTLKLKIKSVSTTKQTVKAMNLVASSKLQKAKVRLNAARPLFDEYQRIIDKLRNCEIATENVFIKPREVKNTAYVLITGNRGLCGSYNSKISASAFQHMDDKNEKILAVGVKGRDYFKRRGKNIIHSYLDVSETALYEDAMLLGDKIISLYTSGEIDEVYVAYTVFNSTLSYEPKVVRLLPIGDGSQPVYDTMRYEPGEAEFSEYAIREYLSVFIFGAILESLTSEQASRMISMDNATKNASKIIASLTLMYNRRRQADITQEIIEIISGASITK
jgi:F-type H+-transporting ATPase subunit gamma